jgi:hypothetical protein
VQVQDVDPVGAEAAQAGVRLRTRFFRELPPPFGSSRRVVSEYFVAITNRSRSAATSSPTSRSLLPSV